MIRTIALLLPLALQSAAVGAQTGSGTVTCTASVRIGPVTTCEGHLAISLVLPQDPISIRALRLTAPASHCSPVGYSVVRPPFATGADVIGTTRILNPGESDFVVLGRGLAAGRHDLRLNATGIVQGCNVGQMHSWGVRWESVIVPE